MPTVLAPAPADSGLKAIPGDFGLPFLGYLPRYIRDPMTLWRERYERYGPVSWFGSLGERNVQLLGPEACGIALSNRDKAFANGWEPLIGPFFHRGLMLLDFDEHLAHRRILQQAFTHDRLATYTDLMHPAIETGLANWSPAPEFRVYPAVKKLTLDLATALFMGGVGAADAARMDEINRAFIACVQASTAYVRTPLPGTRWRRGLHGRRTLERFLRAYLPQRRAEGGDDLFSVLCHIESEDGQRFSDTDIVNHMIFLLMAAHDTSTITITTMLRYLGQHPEWQDRCRAESAALGTDTPALTDLDRLPALDLVMRECLRLVAPVPSLARVTVKDTEVLDFFIPAGIRVSVTPLFSHHQADYWTDPERFDPDRFAAPRREDRSHRFAWEPFGGGVHKCIGLYFSGAEIKTVLHHLLGRYRWSVDPAYETPLDFTALPFPKDGQPVDLRAI